jgi:hypothetical protein
MKNSTYKRLRKTVSTWQKSTARIVFACPARNIRQVCPVLSRSKIGAVW